MKHPIFHPDEEARIGPYAHDRSLVGQICTVQCLMKPIGDEHRYGIKTDGGVYTILLESTLQKRFKRSDWGALKTVWQPKRHAR